jgi:hypothetical protein
MHDIHHPIPPRVPRSQVVTLIVPRDGNKRPERLTAFTRDSDESGLSVLTTHIALLIAIPGVRTTPRD